MTKATDYNITVRGLEIDGQNVFEARVKEFPDLEEYADTPQEAYELAIDAIETVLERVAEKGSPAPVPISVSAEYSGRVTLRLPRSLHRALSVAAENEDISLNQHLVCLLSYFTGFAHARSAFGSDWTPVKAVQPVRDFKVVEARRLRAVESNWPPRLAQA